MLAWAASIGVAVGAGWLSRAMVNEQTGGAPSMTAANEADMQEAQRAGDLAVVSELENPRGARGTTDRGGSAAREEEQPHHDAAHARGMMKLCRRTRFARGFSPPRLVDLRRGSRKLRPQQSVA
jgi:hypothetical protein